MLPFYEAYATQCTLFKASPSISLKSIAFTFQGGLSVLGRLVGAMQAWTGGGGAAVQVISLQPLEGKTPATRVWLSAVGIANFEYLLLYHKNKVNGTHKIWNP